MVNRWAGNEVADRQKGEKRCNGGRKERVGKGENHAPRSGTERVKRFEGACSGMPMSC